MAHKYMVAHVQEATMEAVKLRLYMSAAEATAEDSLEAFEEVWKMSIASGIDVLRMTALQMVKDTVRGQEDEEDEDEGEADPRLGSMVKAKYDADALCPEVMFELRAI